MKRILMLMKKLRHIIMCCTIIHLMNIGRADSIPTSPLLCYVEDRITNSSRINAERVHDVIYAYHSIVKLLEDLSLCLCLDNNDTNVEVLYFLTNVEYYKKSIRTHDFRRIREFVFSLPTSRELRRIAEKNDVKNKMAVASVVSAYKIRPLFDIVFANANHEDAYMRATAYMHIASIGKLAKKESLYCLRHGLKDDGYFNLFPSGTPMDAKTFAANACMELGGRFRRLLWQRASHYNGANQRIKKTVGLVVTESFFNENWQELESVDSGLTTSYVWGVRYIDDLVLREKGQERLYSLADPNWNVVAITDAAGVVQERKGSSRGIVA